MTTTVNLRKLLDRKQWEPISLCPSGTSVGSFVVNSTLKDKYMYYFVSASAIYQYDPNEDGWISLPTSGAGGTFGAGACGAFVGARPQATATGGSTTTLNTNLTAARSMAGYQIQITGGPGAGDVMTILSNTIGANSVITVDGTFSATITSSSTYILYTGMIYFWNAGTMSASSFRVYDRFRGTWSSLSVTSAPSTWGTDGKLIATATRGASIVYASGTASSGASTTLTDSTKTWTTNQLSWYQVRITAGTGAGQRRTIASNTGTVITVSSAWTTNPDATSQYVLEGCGDTLYLLGNNAVTMYRYTISSNTWSTISPSVARAAAPGVSFSAQHVNNVADATWNNESNLLNGRFIYSFRGGASTALDRYDIALNTWSNVVYEPTADTFTTGSGYCYSGEYIYISKEATGRWYRYSVVDSHMTSWGYNWYAQSTAHAGDRVSDITYTDGATNLTWLYSPGNNQTLWFRCLVI